MIRKIGMLLLVLMMSGCQIKNQSENLFLIGQAQGKNGEIKVSKNQLTELSNLLSDNLISNQSAKKILEKIWDTQFLPKDLCDEMDLWQISSEEILYPIVKDTIDCNVKIIEDYKKGKTNAIKTIIGIVMKKTSGKANGNVVNKIISDILNTL